MYAWHVGSVVKILRNGKKLVDVASEFRVINDFENAPCEPFVGL